MTDLNTKMALSLAKAPLALQGKAEEVRKLYLESNTPLQEIALLVGLPAATILSWASRFGWKATRRAVVAEEQIRADEAILSVVHTKRMEAIKRQLALAEKMEKAVDELLSQPGGVSSVELRRLAEVLTHTAAVVSRAVGIDISVTKDAAESVRPPEQKSSKTPLVYIDLTPRPVTSEPAAQMSEGDITDITPITEEPA